METKSYEVWMEGYQAQGNFGNARFLGNSKGTSFNDACQKLVAAQKLESYDAQKNSIWGCRLFDNGSDAARSFG